MTLDVTKELIAAVATIAAAGIAGAIAFISLLITKEQAVSEFRQKWIDSLRDDLAEFLSAVTSISVHAQINDITANRSTDPSTLIAPIETYIGVSYRAYHRTILRLNPIEHKALRNHIIRVERSLTDNSVIAQPEVFGDMCADLSEEAHRVLKTEWKRVKRGEPIYITFKIASGLLFVGLVGWASIFLFNNLGAAS